MIQNWSWQTAICSAKMFSRLQSSKMNTSVRGRRNPQRASIEILPECMVDVYSIITPTCNFLGPSSGRTSMHALYLLLCGSLTMLASYSEERLHVQPGSANLHS